MDYLITSLRILFFVHSSKLIRSTFWTPSSFFPKKCYKIYINQDWSRNVFASLWCSVWNKNRPTKDNQPFWTCLYFLYLFVAHDMFCDLSRIEPTIFNVLHIPKTWLIWQGYHTNMYITIIRSFLTLSIQNHIKIYG